MPERRSRALAFTLALTGAARAGEGWRDLAPLLLPRQEVAVAEAGGKIYLMGGILENRAATDLVERYDPSLDSWERVAPLPRPLHHVGAAELGGMFYALGGLDGGFDGVAGCFRYDPGRESWEEMAPLPTRRGAMGVAALAGKIYAAGGQRTGATVGEFAAFTPGPGRGSWEVLPAMPTARNHLAGAAAGGFFFAISGRVGGRLLPQVERYDPASRTWSPRRAIPTPRGGLAAAVLRDRIYVFGGEGNTAAPSGVFSESEVYDPALDTWRPLLDMSVPRHGIGAAALGGVIYIPGGSEVEGFGVTAANTAYTPPEEDLPGEFIRGDANGDGGLDISDPIAILFNLFHGGPPLACPDSRDSNDDGAVDLSDPIRILEHLFSGGPAPPPPGPLPGPDPTPDSLTCP